MNRINTFVEGFIPKNIPKKKAAVLKEELVCHLLDKADHYMEIGYEMSISIDKAIEEFGTDEDMKNYIRGEFEELYQERTVWGILAGLFILVMNWMCFPLDIWVASADYNRDPDPAGTFVSFCMIYAVIALVIFARIKKYRKMLLCIGISNITVLGILLWCFYPQMAAYSVAYNAVYLIDRFTPLLLGDDAIAHGLIQMSLCVGVPAVLSVYSVIASVLLRTGRIGTVKGARKKCIITGAIASVLCLCTCLLQPVGLRYYDDYPVWFNPYNLFISEETEDIYNRINIGDTAEYAERILSSEGFLSFEAYSGKLDRLTKKQFEADKGALTVLDGYTIYFHPDKYIKGEGLVGVRVDSGIVTGVAVGNVGKYMYDSKNETFGISETRNWRAWDTISQVEDYFGALKIGDSEKEIAESGFGADFAQVYSKRKYVENGSEKLCCRVYYYGVENPDALRDYEENDNRYMELVFTDGVLSSGTLYDRDHIDGEWVFIKKSVN